MMLKPTIQARLSLNISLLVLLIIAIASVASSTLHYADVRFESVDKKWLASTQMLGEMADRMSEFRLSETYRALAHDQADKVTADSMAAEHSKVVEEIQADYVALHPDTGSAELAPFARAWNAYLSAHDAWIRSGAPADAAMNGSPLHQLYVTADDAVDGIVDLNASQAHAQAMSVDASVHRTIQIVAISCLVALLLGAWLLARVRYGITRPLAHITHAMSALAHDRREIAVPERDRADEIGTLAKAFDVFRANLLALEQANRATLEAQEHAQALARHDALTGLPNRRLFNAELEASLNQAKTGDTSYALMMLDLDRFKPINDLQGHAAGDVVLCEVASRLRDTLRKGDMAARLGGDEFAVIAQIENATTAVETCSAIATKILSAIAAPIELANGTIEVGVSIGVTFIPGEAADTESLLQAADVAMYRAKQLGRGRYCFFEPSMGEALRAEAAREKDLRQAIATGTIEPYFQPLVDIRARRIYGFEMLARWRHPVQGSIPPDLFIPLAEKLGLIGDLTWSLLRRACRSALSWDDSINLSVNISPLQLKDPAFTLQLLDTLNEIGFPPARLEIEITESALVDDVEATKQILSSLQQIGIKVALDDFGTGYSSLSHLRDLKFDKVKIDKSFVQAMDTDRESSKIVSAILNLAGSLELPAVAEGIEDATVLDKLSEMGCELAQGYYFSKAVTAAEAAELIGAGVDSPRKEQLAVA